MRTMHSMPLSRSSWAQEPSIAHVRRRCWLRLRCSQNSAAPRRAEKYVSIFMYMLGGLSLTWTVRLSQSMVYDFGRILSRSVHGRLTLPTT